MHHFRSGGATIEGDRKNGANNGDSVFGIADWVYRVQILLDFFFSLSSCLVDDFRIILCISLERRAVPCRDFIWQIA